jgi:outer membrane autotransporter protein
MNRYLLSVASAAVAAMLASSASANTLYFQMNPNFDTGGTRQAFVFGAAGATGTVTGSSGFNQAFDLGAGGFAVITLPTGDELGSGSVENKGFRISSESNVSGYFLSRRTASTDMSYLIDGSRLGTEYVVSGYQNIRDDQMSVQATVDNTTVTFRPVGSDPFNVTLNAGQTYMYTAGSNLTGSRIIGDKPIAVFSGNRCTNIPTGVSACDHIDEQMPSVDQLSKTYLVAQTPRTGENGNVVRVVATQDGTEVRFNGAVVANLDSGSYYEGRIAGGIQIDANNNVLVAQYLIGETEADENTDPAMTIVPGADQWLKSYVFATPSGTAEFPTDFVSIIINTSDIATLTVDGILATPSLFQQLATTAFSFGNIDVSGKTGPFSITAANPFQLLLSGFDSFDSYFTYGGAAFSPGASPPPEEPPPPPPTTTRLHWDGDGEISANNGVVDGGTGTWSATRANFTDVNGVSNGAYNPQPGDVVFTGTGGVVTVDGVNGDIAVTGMAFNVDGYRLIGAPITLAGEGYATIQVGNGTEAGVAFTAQIDSVLQGSAGLVKRDLGTLVLTGSNTYSGGTTVAEGTLVGRADSFGTGGIINDSRLVIDQSAPVGVLNNTLSGLGQLVKIGGGVLTIVGDHGFSGTTSVDAGRLVVTGDLGLSGVTVRSGAALAGTGRVGGVAALAGSTVAPGVGGIGTLRVAGNFAQVAGSTYQVDLASGGSGDRIIATGTGTLASEAVINVTKTDAPRFVLGTRYTVLTAAGGLTGTYRVTGNTKVSRFIDVIGSYDARNAYLNVAQTSSFASAGATPNQTAAASGADNIGNGAMYNAIAYLPTDADARAAFDQISGEIHATLRGAGFEDTRFVREAVAAHLQAPEDARNGIWVHGYGSWGNVDGDGNAAPFKRDIAGFFVGVDVASSDTFKAGILAGYSTSEIRLEDRFSYANTDDAHVGAYAEYQAGGFAGEFGVAYAWRDVKTRRTVAFQGYQDYLTADYQTQYFQMFGDIGYTFNAGSVGIEPFGALAYVQADSDAFRESGGESQLRAVDGASDDYWVSTLGGRLSFGMPVAGAGFGVTAMAGWRHAGGGDLTTPIRMQFSSGGAFDIAGPPIAQDVAALGLKLTAALDSRADLDLGYSGQIGDGLEDHGLKFSLRVRF